MTAKPAAQPAVGPEFEPVYAWPPITPEEWERAEVSLANSLGDMAGIVLGHEIEAEAQRSRIHISGSNTGEDGESLHFFDMTTGIAKALGRKELRYSRMGQHALVGVSEELSSAEREVFDDNYLYQSRVLEVFPLDQIPINDDGSQTFAYRTDAYRSDKLKRLRARIMSEVAPHLSGVVFSTKPIIMTSDDPTSLFHSKHR